jgi:hypothetical protein
MCFHPVCKKRGEGIKKRIKANGTKIQANMYRINKYKDDLLMGIEL